MKHEIDLCLSASCETVRLLHNTYLNRPYFRTWYAPLHSTVRCDMFVADTSHQVVQHNLSTKRLHDHPLCHVSWHIRRHQ